MEVQNAYTKNKVKIHFSNVNNVVFLYFSKMVRQQFHVEYYWKVVVWYDLDYDLFEYVRRDMRGMGFSRRNLEALYAKLRSKKAKAVTISNILEHKSVVLFNKHRNYYDYINSIVHEAEHVKQAMLEAYKVEDEGEPPAYTIGYLAMKMLGGWSKI